MSRKTVGVALLAMGLVFTAPAAATYAMQGHAIPGSHLSSHADSNGTGNGTGQNGGTCNGNGTGNGNCNCNDNGNAQCNVPEVPTPLGIPVAALMVFGGYVWVQRRRLVPTGAPGEIE